MAILKANMARSNPHPIVVTLISVALGRFRFILMLGCATDYWHSSLYQAMRICERCEFISYSTRARWLPACTQLQWLGIRIDATIARIALWERISLLMVQQTRRRFSDSYLCPWIIQSTTRISDTRDRVDLNISRTRSLCQTALST